MPIFHRKALEAAVHPQSLDWLRDEHLADWNGLAAALDRLTPEQRCDAIYADWILQLNSPSRGALLQIRDRLIGDGAIAANYLAELAQNADDAADGKPAKIRIIPNGEWLFVSNDGRKVTSLNLLGLSRFFVHSAGKEVYLDESTIGRFGIGFKSCYRIASEVFVFTWDRHGRYGFRLPICREGDAASVPGASRLDAFLSRLTAVGAGRLDDDVRQVRCLGYCTPEFLDSLPPELEKQPACLFNSERGTLFAFRIRPDRRNDVASRITGQERELYELCLLFLPNLRLVQLAHHELEMSVGDHDAAHDIPGLVEAVKITLTARDINQPGGRQSKSRFWRLRGIGSGDLWEIALHADSSFRLRVDREDDEHGTTIKDGSAYAFFPLNKVSWPFRLHLHLKLPTNLARDDWNPDDSQQIEEQLRRAVSGLALWLEHHLEKWHADWRVELLVARKPNPNERWARLVFERLTEELRNVPLLKTLWGFHHTSQDARTVRLIPVAMAGKNWVEFCSKVTGLDAEYPLVHALEAADFGVPELPANKLKSFFLRAAEQGGMDAVFWRSFVAAAFSAESLDPDALLAVCRDVPIDRPDGPPVKLGDLLLQPDGSTLTPAWHEQFCCLANWLRDVQRGQHALCGRELREQLLKLAKPVFNPTWVELPVVLGTQEAWTHESQGEQFWRTDREACPPGQRLPVVHALRLRDGSSIWKSVTEVWLPNNEAPRCFHGIVKSWERGTVPDFRRLTEIREKIKAWNLWDAWQEAVEERLRDKLGSKLGRELVKHSETTPGIIRLRGPFEEFFDDAHRNSRNGLETRWQAVVKDAELSAMRSLLQTRSAELRASRLIAQEGIEPGLRSVITFWGNYAPCP